MLKKGVACFCVLVCAAVIAGAPARAGQEPTEPNEVMINFCAYTGITLNDMFGSNSIHFRDYVLILKTNLENQTSISFPSIKDTTCIAEQLTILEELEKIVQTLEESADLPNIKDNVLLDFFNDSLAGTYSTVYEKLRDLEAKGLTIPFLAVDAIPDGHSKFKNLLSNKPFVATFGGFTYEKFYQTPKDDPLVTLAMIEMLDEAHKAGVFGTFVIRFVNMSLAKPELVTADRIAELLDKYVLNPSRANGMCCNSVRKCQACAGYNCPICNQTTQACCLGAQSCPK